MDCTKRTFALIPSFAGGGPKANKLFQTNIKFRLIEGEFDHREQIVSRPAGEKTKGARNFRSSGKSVSLKDIL